MKQRLNWNWGKGIVLVYALFVCGMLYLVFQSKAQKLDLVVDDYYQQELKFQDQIDASRKAIAAGLVPKVETEAGQNFLTIAGTEGKAVKGTLLAYCAADKARDQKMELHETTAGRWQLPLSGLSQGTYVFKIHWQTATDRYYAELNFDK